MACGDNVQAIAVGKLTEHPGHAELFGCLPDPNARDLITSLDVDGQVDPVLVTVDGQVVDGWRRVVAAGELGWPQVDVVVLRDVQDQEEAAIKAHMLRLELSKRQIGPLSDAWLYRALMRTETRNPSWALTAEGRKLTRRRLAARLGDPSNEKLGRYERILRLPRVFQVAISTGTLDMSRALKVYRFSSTERKEIAHLFQEYSPKRAVDHYLKT